MSGHGKVTMEEGENMPIKKVNHIAIAVKDIDKGISCYRDILRLPYYGTQIVEAAGCKAAFFGCGDLEIELVQGIEDFAAVNRFIEERGEGLYHIAYEVDDLEQDMRYFRSIGVGLRNPVPRPGANHTLVNYIDAEAGHGVISELVQNTEQ